MKALVVAVNQPVVACEPGTVEVTVIYTKQLKFEHIHAETGEVWYEPYTKKVKRKVFATERPKLHSWIEVAFA